MGRRRMIFNRLVHNTIMSRMMAFRNRLDGPCRDLDEECGYISDPQIEDYKDLYDREGIAKRVNDVFPDECFAIHPQIYETEENRKTKFERAWEKLNRRLQCISFLHRADKMSGIGSFGIILLGLPGRMDTPVRGINRDGTRDTTFTETQELAYIRVFSEEHVQITKYEEDEFNPRHGQPVEYTISFMDPAKLRGGANPTAFSQRKVHWTRVIHLADNREESEVHGTPRMRAVLNRLQDLRKILGSSAEMFYKGGFPGYVFQSFPELTGEAELDEDSVKDQIDDYMNGLKRWLSAVGGEFKSLAPQVADPSKHVEQQIIIISATIGVPARILLGSEAGHLASTQDAGTWNKRVSERQMLYVEPYVIRPFIDRLMMLNVLPFVEEYVVCWEDLNTMSDTDKANVALKRAQALMQYVSGGCETVIAPREFLTLILGYNPEEADAIIEAAKTNPGVTTEVWKKPEPAPAMGARGSQLNGKKNGKTQGGGRRGNAPRNPPGRPAQTTARA